MLLRKMCHSKGERTVRPLGFLWALDFSPSIKVYTKSLSKSSKKALLSYVVFNNVVSAEGKKGSEEIVVGTPLFRINRLLSYIALNNVVSLVIVVLTPFSKGEGAKLTTYTTSDFLSLAVNPYRNAIFSYPNDTNNILTYLDKKRKNKNEKKF